MRAGCGGDGGDGQPLQGWPGADDAHRTLAASGSHRRAQCLYAGVPIAHEPTIQALVVLACMMLLAACVRRRAVASFKQLYH